MLDRKVELGIKAILKWTSEQVFYSFKMDQDINILKLIMTKIDSKKSEVPASANQVYDFLMDMNNIEKLLPPGKYSDWKSDALSCSFKVQSAYQIGLKFLSSTPHSNVNYESGSGSPFSFNLIVNLVENNGITSSQLVCEAQINPFLEMLVKGPLKNLFDYMAEKLTEQF